MGYLFTQIHEKWYLEICYGEDGGTSFVMNNPNGRYIGESKIMPFLIGGRYDWLPAEYNSPIQPYFSCGVGLYKISKYLANSEFTNRVIADETNMKYGFYGGTGFHFVIFDWIALNCDIKYHVLNFNPFMDYSGLQIGFGSCILIGRKRKLFNVDDVKLIVKDVYPTFYQFYNTYPIALVTVKNTAGYSLKVNVIANIKELSESKYRSESVEIKSGKTKDIPIFAHFGPKLFSSTNRGPAVIDIEIEAKAKANNSKQKMSLNLIVHNKNAWNGQVDKLGFFITPDNEKIIKLTREISNDIDNNSELKKFNLAKAVFNKLKEMGIRYQSDPNILFYKDDRVQFAHETIELRSGDCDDLVVLYSSMLESLGIRTAFVDVNDPEKDIAHVYLLLDSGLTWDKGYLISSNEKRFVISDNYNSEHTIWIPIETTLIEKGFEEAWKSGATGYLHDGIVRNGINDKWVKIINVESVHF